MVENNLSSVKITHKVEMKTGKAFTEWEIKVKHEDAVLAGKVAVEMDRNMRERYSEGKNDTMQV